ncbi:MAG TPA: hypothetical protein VFG94_01850, partial [Acidimicrobiales bacterium]|nr:hypothetical protein [Acidimicrobiales bacterium]
QLHLFEQVADALHALLPPELGPWQERNHRYGIKVWLGADRSAPREHFEAQVVGAKHVPGARTLAIEVGFHAEHPDRATNEAVLADLVAREAEWRADLGDEAVAGTFLGTGRGWQRLSETWPDPDLGAAELAFEVAARLTDYLLALGPLVRAPR